MARYNCSACDYSFSTDKKADKKPCPYCGKRKVEEKTGSEAQDLIDEVASKPGHYE